MKRISTDSIARTPLQLGSFLRERRRQSGLTQEQLATRVGVRQRTISDLEATGIARTATLLAVLAALDLELVVRPRTKSTAHDIEALF